MMTNPASMSEQDAMLQTVHIVCAFDDAYAPHFATLAASLAASRGAEVLRLTLIVGPGLGQDTIRRLEAYLTTLHLSLEYVRVPDAVVQDWPSTGSYPSLVWYRLLLPELLPEVSRVIYLDTDTLVLHSLLPLYQTELGTDLMGAVASPKTGFEDHCQRMGIDPVQGYFNSGVLLMNLEQMRREHFTRQALQAAKKAGSDTLVFPDQDLLNRVAQGRWKKLHPQWNAISYLWLDIEKVDHTYSALEYAVAAHSPVIVHFEGPVSVKPWYFRCVHPLREIYRQLRAQTPWPLRELEGRSWVAALLRPLPLQWQYGIARTRQRISGWLRR